MGGRRLPLLLALVTGCGATHHAPEPEDAGRGVVLEWDAGMRPLSRAGSNLELYAPAGGREALARAAPAYFRRADVLANEERVWKTRALEACAEIGGEVTAWTGELPTCALPDAEVENVPRRAVLRAPTRGDVLSGERIGEIVGQGLVTCNEEGHALVGWTRHGEWLLPICGRGDGHVFPWTPPVNAPIVATCAEDIDGDGQVELAVLLEGGARDQLGVYDGPERYSVDEGNLADDATRLSCGAGRVGLGPQRAPETHGYAWTGYGFEQEQLPG